MNFIQYTAVCAAMVGLSGCSSSVEDYQGTTPEFKLKEYFSGNLTAWGIVQDINNKTTRRFCVDIIGTWQGDSGKLHETFYYADGETQIRQWQLNIQQDGTVTGSAGDVIGQASGEANGMSFNWHYTLRVPVDDSEFDLKVDDWMYMLDEKRMMNRSYMSKLGIGVAEISIFFDKTEPLRKCQ
ncbi:DUF3833 domain-containing protein [Aliiglaciecola lipolytica]|uniref:DUF3833 domain-containing protein n=1 Tax=Aliiglaciecola lipolytica TaxID=477689 RepID=UPI001C09E85A|nr:DUF3833 domain-containing protein [Aliiglaciecola lipolytica]MBU2879784.1 DUF3833 domain-containing protein [Aliiglaciecola lipolytica]